MINIDLTDEQARHVTVRYIVQSWNINKDCMDDSEHYKYYWICKEFASPEELKHIETLFKEYYSR